MQPRRGGTASYRVLGPAKPGKLLLKLFDFRALREKRAPQNPDYRPDVRSIQAGPAIGYGGQTGWNCGSKCFRISS